LIFLESTPISNRRENDQGCSFDTVNDACVSVRGSRIHGMGLFADQPFKKGDVVAEYIGEYIVNPVADEREKIYRDHRIQDYQFRLNDKLVIDATMKGGHGRYINHNCTPNCFAKIIPHNLKLPSLYAMSMGFNDYQQQPNNVDDKDNKTNGEDNSSQHQLLRRLVIIAQQDIDINEEITYDYQFPLELDLSARVPCNCLSEACRGFMNWDLPEKGANNRALLVQKRVANMRDRIRRLNRPLKRDES
jgi:SET domain-containing protein